VGSVNNASGTYNPSILNYIERFRKGQLSIKLISLVQRFLSDTYPKKKKNDHGHKIYFSS